MFSVAQLIGKVIWHVCGPDGYGWDAYNSKQIARQHLARYYSPKSSKVTIAKDHKQVIAMCDGRIYHGGLSDRLRGITSLYAWCKSAGVDFKIHFTHPFPLAHFLVPNLYDWSCSEQEISYNSKISEPLYISVRKQRKTDVAIQQKRLSHIVQSAHRQFHVYTNLYLYDNEFKERFEELFRPSELLQQAIDQNLRAIGGKYVAVVFRFQQLLGDFREDGYKVLAKEQREALISRCLESLDSIRNKTNASRILVTSDSTTFLNRAQQKEFVHVVSGDVVHMEYTTDASEQVYLKSFVDLFMLSHAEKVYLVVGPDMYHSGFAQRGALISGIPYEEIEL